MRTVQSILRFAFARSDQVIRKVDRQRSTKLDQKPVTYAEFASLDNQSNRSHSSLKTFTSQWSIVTSTRCALLVYDMMEIDT